MNDEMRTKRPASFGRRSFLFAAAGTGAAGLAAVSGAARAATPEEAAKAEPEGEGKGYRVTGHVARYYRSTRL
ncbi:formate dehydrogenase [Nitrogeniibacter mangrovi]|uniref:Formate dehydrogenase n=1 Tax=Nitrogeniibacter mangrovi TaxID=2016596 RepID=A0A6C1AY99_9RHOO|nr:formate dehydrogenase [Nitrogeniibacter mangrovi]QID16317.1 formate dehydrogenase [Nitrogeniibacter mangrovi]